MIQFRSPDKLEFRDFDFTPECAEDLRQSFHRGDESRVRTVGWGVANLLVSNGVEGNEANQAIQLAINRCEPPLERDLGNMILSGAFLEITKHLPLIRTPISDEAIQRAVETGRPG